MKTVADGEGIIPRSSLALSSRTASLYASPSSCLAKHKIEVVFPIPGIPEMIKCGMFPSFAIIFRRSIVSVFPTMSSRKTGRYFSTLERWESFAIEEEVNNTMVARRLLHHSYWHSTPSSLQQLTIRLSPPHSSQRPCCCVKRYNQLNAAQQSKRNEWRRVVMICPTWMTMLCSFTCLIATELDTHEAESRGDANSRLTGG